MQPPYSLSIFQLTYCHSIAFFNRISRNVPDWAVRIKPRESRWRGTSAILAEKLRVFKLYEDRCVMSFPLIVSDGNLLLAYEFCVLLTWTVPESADVFYTFKHICQWTWALLILRQALVARPTLCRLFVTSGNASYECITSRFGQDQSKANPHIVVGSKPSFPKMDLKTTLAFFARAIVTGSRIGGYDGTGWDAIGNVERTGEIKTV
ncbi:uncharacterized protein LAESUDRAFT_749773 [Laetiporus sulphureus 93-53]|uniref:Uncharacterized protein n=1 Tax=Laetiporus sulphureus 93-53 TaxID=1314785 RepID=A0A165EDZ2_9APHY|nr:uncharacterized protein LAESUDRAFT_749773 [Laetiporus sulphureus 93-53]KZT06833.1 hypothetical protein LAESUDRAFT_749773 [Laetiporus sulphureus 93-53]